MTKNDKPKRPSELLLKNAALHPIWLNVSEAAKVFGVNNKTIRRAISEQVIKYKIVGERYFIDFSSLLIFIHSRTKLANKFNEYGLGQYIESWRHGSAITKHEQMAKEITNSGQD
ncbi:MAG: helix-turn-helix domain-containing protein [Patescibacteria group bacterium]|jgi:excisionase family DNA binding protein